MRSLLGVADALLACGPRSPHIVHLNVREQPGLGTPKELLAAAAIGAEHIKAAVTTLLAAQ